MWGSGVGDVLSYTQCDGCLVWWMSGVVDVRCGGCLVWWMSYFTCSVVDVWCGGCLCGGCRTIQKYTLRIIFGDKDENEEKVLLSQAIFLSEENEREDDEEQFLGQALLFED